MLIKFGQVENRVDVSAVDIGLDEFDQMSGPNILNYLIR